MRIILQSYILEIKILLSTEYSKLAKYSNKQKLNTTLPARTSRTQSGLLQNIGEEDYQLKTTFLNKEDRNSENYEIEKEDKVTATLKSDDTFTLKKPS
mmetsp:Transcript_13647/g.15305  ORF Transcript_13647/g.15305 Transcript_13647/m.15305 type:complete len:98 (+) Transcript_13647:211-504(+)